MKTAAAVRSLISLLLILHFSKAQESTDDPSIFTLFSATPQSLLSLLLLGLTVFLSSCIYLWALRYVCIGCCQPVAVGTEPEDLSGMV